VGLREEDSESKPAPEGKHEFVGRYIWDQLSQCTKMIGSSDPFPMKRLGENSKPDTQVSPDRLLRAALLRSRYADVIVKARGILSQV
jgi:hypothetical protein